MSEPAATSTRMRTATPATAGDAVYGLGLIGALVYFWRQSNSVGGHVRAVLKALVWPAFLVHEAFQRLNDKPNDL